MSYLTTAYHHVSVVKRAIQVAQIPQDSLTVTSLRTVYKDQLQFIDIDTKELIDLDVTIRDASQMQAQLTRSAPAAYLIHKGQIEMIEKLQTLGIQVEQLEQETSYKVEAFKIIEYDRATARYEKMKLQTVKTSLENKSIAFSKGTFIIYTNQKNAPLLAEVLEPEAPNSFVSFGVLETSLNEELPIYRLPKTI
jgi:hypothetical protein